MLGAPKEWSIAIHAGPSLDALEPLDGHDPPTLTFRAVADFPSRFVADPFLVRHEDEWLLFFESLNAAREKGEIALARSADALHWRFDGTILREPFHLSYPNVFPAAGEWWMTPEALEAGGVLLYRAVEFPRRWSLHSVLVEGVWADPTVFEHDRRWWMFACSTPYEHDRLDLFWADDVCGPWRRHPRSPVVSGDPRRARPAGRPCVVDGALVRFAQDCRPDYGSAVRAFAVTTLTRRDYAEQELAGPVVAAAGSGWNADGMHSVDLHPWRGRWIAAVDGYCYRSAPQCTLVSTLDDFDALAGEWAALLGRSPAHAVFGSHSWTRAALVSRSDCTPHVGVLRIDGRLEAILPLVRTAEGIEFATNLSDYNDFIAAESRHAARAFHWLLGRLPRGSRVALRGLREGSDTLAIARASAPAACSPETSCLYADVETSYFRTRSQALRKSIARARRAAAKAHAEVTLLADEANVPQIFLTLNRQRFGDRSRFAELSSQAFVREALPPLLRSGAIEPYALVRRGEVLAIDLVLVTGDALAPWNGGFTAEAAPLSPGRLLFAAEIEKALEAGKARFDLLRGTHPYKRAWSTGSRPLHRAEVLAP